MEFQAGLLGTFLPNSKSTRTKLLFRAGLPGTCIKTNRGQLQILKVLLTETCGFALSLEPHLFSMKKKHYPSLETYSPQFTCWKSRENSSQKKLEALQTFSNIVPLFICNISSFFQFDDSRYEIYCNIYRFELGVVLDIKTFLNIYFLLHSFKTPISNKIMNHWCYSKQVQDIKAGTFI